MVYTNIRKAVFLCRINRFIAKVDIDGEEILCHVKNTGRCRELFIENAQVFIQYEDKPGRKTKYSLISVVKNNDINITGRLINVDSQAPNKIFLEWILKGNFFKRISDIKPEFTYKNSRFDLYCINDGKKVLVEIKGVTLEENGVVYFPDAPTERGLKHIYELCDAKSNGYEAYIIFIIQMKDVMYLSPNYKTHKAFGEALAYARSKGVIILAFDCNVTENSIQLNKEVEVVLNGMPDLMGI